ncbi:MAG: hypothetical protein D6751_05520 [Deltaproteobacteria bacterium]|nr:MAG: hypothetical protein D6751_05520 [Deltaproteobacteria bacterium]
MNVKGINPDHLRRVQQYVLDVIAGSASQNEAANKLGISPSHLINFRDGHWKAVSRKMFNKLAGLAGVNNWGTYQTENLLLATSVAAAAQDESRMLALVGFTGSGKTHALRLYGMRTRNAYYMLAHSEMNKKMFLTAMLKALGVRIEEAGHTVGLMLDAVVRKLQAETQPLLIIDDAGKLTDSNLRIIQIIYDRTEGHAGILLAGTEYLEESLTKKARANKMGFRELRRRIAWWEQMGPLTRKDVGMICQANGIEDKGAMAWLYSNCRDFGTLRNMITNALRYAETHDTEVTRDLLETLNAKRKWYEAPALV